jgi:hypothetical protein
VGLLPDQFFDMTWANYNRCAYGYIKRKAQEWEHTRTVVSMIYNANVGKRQDQKKPDQILPLWTDNIGKPKKPKQQPLTKDEFEKVVKKLEKNG